MRAVTVTAQSTQGKEKNRGDELVRVLTHIYMEMSQGNSL
jgi:hypothetical protein